MAALLVELSKNENIVNYIKEGIKSEKAMDILVKNAKIKKETVKKETKKETKTEEKKESKTTKSKTTKKAE